MNALTPSRVWVFLLVSKRAILWPPSPTLLCTPRTLPGPQGTEERRMVTSAEHTEGFLGHLVFYCRGY